MVMLVKFSYGYHCCWPKNHATIHNRKIRLFFFVCFFFLRSNPSKEKRTYDQIIIKRNKKTVRLMFSYSSRRCILTRSHRIFPIVDDIGRQFGVDKSLRHVFLTFFGRGVTDELPEKPGGTTAPRPRVANWNWFAYNLPCLTYTKSIDVLSSMYIL